MTHTVALFIYPGFELLDAAGPASVFAQANHVLQARGAEPYYSVETVSLRGGPVCSSSGISLDTYSLARHPPARVDTLLVAGAERESLAEALREAGAGRWLHACAESVSRLGSVCSGAFVLAALGLLDGRRVASHWEGCAPLSRLYPAIKVDPEALYVADGNIWTSAGVTAGIDMALAMVNNDVGSEISLRVAQRLVLYLRRPGHQSQFSPLLMAQIRADNPFCELIDWICVNLDKNLDVPCLAARVGFSERSFYRKFVKATGKTPAHFVETLRLDAARVLLTQGLPIKSIAAQVGLAPAARLKDAFERRFGLSPRLFREMHAGF
jgi:transcriptional regulator GlxA family with amidase domain